jgi:ABC-2 type transport system permease protein
VNAFTAVLRYEFRMQLRKPSVWLVTGLTVLLLVVLGNGALRTVLDGPGGPGAAKATIISLGFQLHALLPIGYGCLLADRLIRDDRLRVAAVLDATPSGPGWRLLGKYAGAASATAVPIVALYAALAVGYAVVKGEPAALTWALATFGLVMVPGLLFVAAFALAVPLVMPAPLFRVLFVGYWVWGNMIPPELMPTLARTVVQPGGGYAFNVLLGDHSLQLSGPAPGAFLNVLRPEATTGAAWLSIALLLVLAAAALVAGQALRARRGR